MCIEKFWSYVPCLWYLIIFKGTNLNLHTVYGWDFTDSLFNSDADILQLFFQTFFDWVSCHNDECITTVRVLFLTGIGRNSIVLDFIVRNAHSTFARSLYLWWIVSMLPDPPEDLIWSHNSLQDRIIPL